MRRIATHGFTLVEMTIVTVIALAGLTLTVAAIQVASRAVSTVVDTAGPTDQEKARTRQLLANDLRNVDPFTVYVAAGGVATQTINTSTVPRWSETALPIPHTADTLVKYEVENGNLVRQLGNQRQVVMRNIGSISGQVNLCVRTVRVKFYTSDDDPQRALSVQLPLTGLLNVPVTYNDFNNPASWQHRYTRWDQQLALDLTCAESVHEVGTLLRLANPNVSKTKPPPDLHKSGGPPAAVFQTAHDCLRIKRDNRAIFYCLEPPLGGGQTTQLSRMIRYERRDIPQLNPQNRFIPTLDGLRFWCGAINPEKPMGDSDVDNWQVFFQDPVLENTKKESVRNACWQLMNAREKGTEVTTRTLMDGPKNNQDTIAITGIQQRSGSGLYVKVLTGDRKTAMIPLFAQEIPNEINDARSVDLNNALKPLTTQLRTPDTHCDVPIILRKLSNRRSGQRTFSSDDAESIWLHGIDCRD